MPHNCFNNLFRFQKTWRRMNMQDAICHDSKVHGANMGPIWGRQDPGGPLVGPMNFAGRFSCDPNNIKVYSLKTYFKLDRQELIARDHTYWWPQIYQLIKNTSKRPNITAVRETNTPDKTYLLYCLLFCDNQVLFTATRLENSMIIV